MTPWRLWALRRASWPLLAIPCRITTPSAFDLEQDLIDDYILEDVCGPLSDVYFPGELERLVSPLMLQIGAHTGIVAVELLRRAPSGRLIALEPNPLAAGRLRHHLRLNGLRDSCQVVESALADRDGNIRLRTSRDGSWGDSTYPGNNESPYLPGGTWVRATTLAHLLNGREPDLVLCNAEGAEFAFVPQLISLGLRPAIMVLMTHSRHGNATAIVDALRAAGFVVAQAGDNTEHLHCRPCV